MKYYIVILIAVSLTLGFCTSKTVRNQNRTTSLEMQHTDTTTNAEIDVEELLKIAVGSEDTEERIRAVNSLGLSWNQEVIQPLIGLLDDPEVQYFAAIALGNLRAMQAFEHLRAGLDSENKLFRFSCLYAISLLPAIDPADKEDIMLQALQDPYKHVKLAAIWGLDMLNSQRALIPLIRASLQDDQDIANNARYAAERIMQFSDTEFLTQKLQSAEDIRVKLVIIDFFGRFQIVDAQPVIIAEIKSTNATPDLIRGCLQALIRIKDQRIIPELVKIYRVQRQPGIKQEIYHALQQLEAPERILNNL